MVLGCVCTQALQRPPWRSQAEKSSNFVIDRHAIHWFASKKVKRCASTKFQPMIEYCRYEHPICVALAVLIGLSVTFTRRLKSGGTLKIRLDGGKIMNVILTICLVGAGVCGGCDRRLW